MSIKSLRKLKKSISLKSRKLKTQKLIWIPALGFLLTIVIGNIFPTLASATGQVQSRSINISSSCVSGGSPCTGTGVTYAVGFTTATAGAIEGVIVDFCSNDPIIGDSCTAPTAFTVGATPTVNATFTGLNPTTSSSWTTTSLNSGRTFEMYDATASTSIGSATAITFSITNVTNPSSLGSFYARIYTYASSASVSGGAYTATAPGSYTDAGGVALSTVNTITITAKVQEQLTFCVYTAVYDGGGGTPCSAATGTAVTLGNSNGVLSTTQAYLDVNTKYDIQTNAAHGAAIVFTGPTLTSGSNVIESSTNSGTGATAGTTYASTPGSPQFGLCTWAANGTTANLTPVAPYNDSNCNNTTTNAGPSGSGVTTAKFGFDIANAANVTNHTLNSYGYGSELATEVAGNFASGQIAFVGNISNTSVAGIYATTLTFIATGTY